MITLTQMYMYFVVIDLKQEVCKEILGIKEKKKERGTLKKKWEGGREKSTLKSSLLKLIWLAIDFSHIRKIH